MRESRFHAEIFLPGSKAAFHLPTDPPVGGPALRLHPLRTEAPPTVIQCQPRFPSSRQPSRTADAPLGKMAADSEVSSAPWARPSPGSVADASGPRLDVCALLSPRSPSPRFLRLQTSPRPRSGKGECLVLSGPGGTAQVTLVLRETPTSGLCGAPAGPASPQQTFRLRL